jgi:hypothetical protein
MYLFVCPVLQCLYQQKIEFLPPWAALWVGDAVVKISKVRGASASLASELFLIISEKRRVVYDRVHPPLLEKCNGFTEGPDRNGLHAALFRKEDGPGSGDDNHRSCGKVVRTKDSRSM